MYFESEEELDVGVIAIITAALDDAFNLDADTLDEIREGANIASILEFDEDDYEIFTNKLLDEHLAGIEFEELEEDIIQLSESNEGLTLRTLTLLIEGFLG